MVHEHRPRPTARADAAHDHGRQLQVQQKLSRSCGGVGYQRYDNFDAIEVPFTDAIPSDYDGVMGVPITWLTKYNPDQFEILGNLDDSEDYASSASSRSARSSWLAYRAIRWHRRAIARWLLARFYRPQPVPVQADLDPPEGRIVMRPT